MAVDAMIAGGMMDVNALENSGPYFSRFTNNIVPSGTDTPTYQRAGNPDTLPGTSPHGGITYIDQAVGGWATARPDVTAWATRGFRSYRSRTQPFTGSFLGARSVIPSRNQGFVGLQGSGAAQRALSVVPTTLPDRGDVLAGFANPALAQMLATLRGK